MTFNAREWWVEWVQWVATSHARENGWGFKKYAILIGPGIRNPLNPPNPQLAGKEIPETAADGHVRQADGDPPEKRGRITLNLRKETMNGQVRTAVAARRISN